MGTLTITVQGAGDPVGQGNHRRNQWGATYETTKGHAAWRNAVGLMARTALRGRAPITGPVRLSAEFRFARPPSHLKKSGGLKKGKPRAKVSAPDLSKLVRCIEDALTDAGVWEDDSRVVAYGSVTKRYCFPGEEGVTIWVEPIDGEVAA